MKRWGHATTDERTARAVVPAVASRNTLRLFPGRYPGWQVLMGSTFPRLNRRSGPAPWEGADEHIPTCLPLRGQHRLPVFRSLLPV